MPVKKLRAFLDTRNIRYVSVRHSPAYSPQEISALYNSGNHLAKTVLVKLDGKVTMAVLPSSHQINYASFKKASGAKEIRPASVEEFKGLFPDCDIGALPPFGTLYGMNVFVARPLTELPEIAFPAGSHAELIRLAYEDYENTVNPRVFDFSVKRRS